MKPISLKTIQSFVWRAAFILLMLVMVSSHFTFRYAAKYVTQSSGDDSARVARFSYSAKINGVSALSFTNTNFWGENTDGTMTNVAMNTLRSIDFTINNYKENQEDVISEVAMQYTLEFVVPVTFGQDLAFQLFDGSDSPLLPQIVMTDFFKAGNDSKQLDTSKSIDYNAENTTDLIFATELQDSKYIAKNGNTTITVEEIIRENVKQTLFFRVWDVRSFNLSDVTGESGDLLAPLEVSYFSNLRCLKISISMPQFVFSAGEKQSENYKVRLTPTMAIDDSYLNAELCTGTTHESRVHQVAPGGYYYLVGKTDLQAITVAEVRQKLKDLSDYTTYTTDNPFKLFSETVFIDGKPREDYYISNSYSKTYPMIVKVLFEQID